MAHRLLPCTAEHADYISLFLVLEDIVAMAVKAQQKFSFAGEVKGQAPSLGSSAEVNHYSWQQAMGIHGFVRRADLEESEHLQDDSFTVRCDIVVISDYRVEDLPESTPPPFVSVSPPDLHQHLGDLLRTEKGADVVFEVAGETFAAHRCLLAARSPVFSAMLFGGMKEGNTVHIHDMEAQVFKALLCFAYTDSLAGTAEEEEEKEDEVMFQHLLVAADRYNMERLKSVCEDKLCNHIDVCNVGTILALAEQHHCDGLSKACLSFLGSPANLRAFMDSDGFDHLSRSCPPVIKKLIAILSFVS
uniref:Uncharacterized protein n=1 Tax=Avena sativa TaxID=4498 RepID=A0ACD5WGC7_AVESA